MNGRRARELRRLADYSPRDASSRLVRQAYHRLKRVPLDQTKRRTQAGRAARKARWRQRKLARLAGGAQ